MKKNFILCGLAGWCMEVLWTGLGSIVSRDPKLTCRTSVWMFPIYGLAAFLGPIGRRLKDRNLLCRGGLYTLLIFVTEYTSGAILKKFHRLKSKIWNIVFQYLMSITMMMEKSARVLRLLKTELINMDVAANKVY